MKTRTLITLLATCSIVMISAGCATDMARVNFDNKINSAYGHVQEGAFGKATKSLESANKIAEEKGYDQTLIKRLLVETHLGLGEPIEAYNLAQDLLTENDRDPYACELMGKVLVKEGRFADAEEYFVTAESEYEAEEDVARCKDLTAMVRGLRSYESGQPKVAQRYWREIENTELKFSLDKAQKEMTASYSNNERSW